VRAGEAPGSRSTPRGQSRRQPIVSLQQELEALEKENVAASRVLDLRRKQFSLLLHTVRAPSLTCLCVRTPVLQMLPVQTAHDTI